MKLHFPKFRKDSPIYGDEKKMKFYRGKTVLVTGGAGFVGSHLAHRLSNLGAKVTVIDNLERGSLENIEGFKDKVRFVYGDLRVPQVCEELIKGDLVFHLAFKVGGIPYTGAKQFFGEIWHDGTLINTNVIHAAYKNKVDKFLFTSSACVYSNKLQSKPDSPPLKENQTSPADCDDAYGWSKLMGEKQCEWYHDNYDFKSVIVRPFNIYGPREYLDRAFGHCLPVFCRKAIEYPEKPFDAHGSGLNTRSFIEVDDIVGAMLLIMKYAEKPIPYNVGTLERTSIRDLADEIIEISGKNIDIQWDLNYPVTGAMGRIPSLERIENDIGWSSQIPLEKGLKKTYQWVEEYLKTHNED